MRASLRDGCPPASALLWFGSPVHKKGAAGDPANYRPIAVGELLYTIILSDRLEAWSEEHGLCSLVQAGFHPRQSPIHHLFTSRCFIGSAMLLQRPLFVSFVDL